MTPPPNWPVWDRRHPGDLWRYVHPDVVAALIERRGDGSLGGLPGPGAGTRRERVAAMYDALRHAGIRYADERFDENGQHVRDPEEILGFPRNGNCLDLSVTFAAACLYAGLHPLIVVLDRERGPSHAIVLVWMNGEWRGGAPLDDEPHPLSSRPDATVGAIRDEPDGHGAFLAVDVALAAENAAFEEAVASGAALLARETWSVGVDVGRFHDRERAHPVWRGANPLTAPYADPKADPDPDGDKRPLRALWARFPTVKFTRRPELDLLWDFFERNGTDPGSVRFAVVHAEGGAGKTRLAAELAHRLANEKGWITGFLPRNETKANLRWLARTVSPLLVVVDYAEAAREEDLSQLFRILRRDRRGQRACVLLTSRTLPNEQGSWWGTLKQSLTESAGGRRIAEPLPIALDPRHPDPDRLFRRAYESFDGTSNPKVPAGQWSTLDLVMHAWLAADDPTTTLPNERTDLYDKILGHEIRHWNGAYQRRFAAALPEPTLREALSCVTAAGPTAERLDIILRACPGIGKKQRQRLTELVPALLPADGDGELRLQPDPVGDHLAATTFAADLSRGADGLTAEEARPLLLRCLDRCSGNDDIGGELLNAYLTITRSAQTDPTAAGQLADTALRPHGIPEPRVHWTPAYAIALAIGGPFAGALARLKPDAALDELYRSASRIPPGHSALAGLAVVAARRDLDESVVDADDETLLAAQADRLNTLSVRLSDLGGTANRAEALSSSEQAVALFHQLGNKYLPDLAMSLTNLGNRLSEAGHRTDALTATQEAVAIRRALAEASPAAYLPNLAMSLNNLGIRLSEAGHRTDALTATQEAVTIRRALAEASPAAYLPDLAGSLNNLGAMLSEAGRRTDALAPTEEAVTLYRRLAETSPAAHLHRVGPTPSRHHDGAVPWRDLGRHRTLAG